jgi:hypothetical protein
VSTELAEAARVNTSPGEKSGPTPELPMHLDVLIMGLDNTNRHVTQSA